MVTESHSGRLGLGSSIKSRTRERVEIFCVGGAKKPKTYCISSLTLKMQDSLAICTAGKHWGKSQNNLGGKNKIRSWLGNDRENRSGKWQQKKPTKDNMVLSHKKWQAVEHRRALTAQRHEGHSHKHNILVNRADSGLVAAPLGIGIGIGLQWKV